MTTRLAAFRQMQAAELALDDATELRCAIAILKQSRSVDAVGEAAVARIQQRASASEAFAAIEPGLQRLVIESGPYAPRIAEALLASSTERGANMGRWRKASGLITSCRIAGTFGRYNNVDLDRTFAPERDLLAQSRYGNIAVEQFAFADGELRLPGYLPRAGVVYASADVVIPRTGTYEVALRDHSSAVLFVDGRRFIHERRFIAGPDFEQFRISLNAGRHAIVLKLPATSGPVKLSVTPPAAPANLRHTFAPEANLAAALAHGDIATVLCRTKQATVPVQLWLRAQALFQAGDDVAALTLARKLAARQPEAYAVRLLLAQAALAEEHYEEAARQLHILLQKRPESASVIEAYYQLVRHFGWQQEMHRALELRLKLRPNAPALRDAIAFYHAAREFDRVEALEVQLAKVSPSSTWQLQLERGDFAAALLTIQQRINAAPLDRDARLALVRADVLAGNAEAAQRAANQLAQLSPNSTHYAALSHAPEKVLDSSSPATSDAGFATQWIRDPAEELRRVADGDSSVAARVIFHDHIVRFTRNGTDVIEHVLTQANTKLGVDLLGEVSVPPDAELLALNTVKSTGKAIEAEAIEQKSSISMPGLTPGDAVELEYLRHVRNDQIAEALTFSPAADRLPVLSAKMVVLHSGASAQPLHIEGPWIRSKTATADVIELRDYTPAKAESHSVGATSPRIASAQQQLEPDALRDALISATLITPRIAELAAALPGKTAAVRATNAYAAVQSISNSQDDWTTADIASADDSFAQQEGSRTAALFALLTAMGAKPRLYLAQERSTWGAPSPPYSHPVIGVAGERREMLFDTAAAGYSAGDISAAVTAQAAIAVDRNSFISEAGMLPANRDESSTEQITVNGGRRGQGRLSLTLQLGASRSAEARRELRGATTAQRKSYIEHLVSQAYPDATEIRGEISALGDIGTHVLVTASATLSRALNLERLLPAVTLARDYADEPARQTAVLVDTPTDEVTEVTLSLPQGVGLELPESITLNESFGTFSFDTHRDGKNMRIRREVHVPAQIIAQGDYERFSRFAIAVDEAGQRPLSFTAGKSRPAAALASADVH